MSKENEIDVDTDDLKDDCTLYGEFISSYFAWLPLKRQKERAKELGKMTNRKNSNKK